MQVQHISYQKTGYFSKIMCDYLNEDPQLKPYYGNFPTIEGFKKQVASRIASNIDTSEKREVLASVLLKQCKNLLLSDLTISNIQLLKFKNTFTITTGHQLNIFSGPLYFLYKIISTINLTKELKAEFPENNYVPVYWMATEDHDFEEINYFNFKGKKLVWNRKDGGPVGRFSTDGMDAFFEAFATQLGTSKNAEYLKKLFQKSYIEHATLTEATRFLVNELFGEYGLVIIDGDDAELKQQFVPFIKAELFEQQSFKKVSETNNLLAVNYKIQVNPREINLFYIKDHLRERILFENDIFKVNNTAITFSKSEIEQELTLHPERFSPNVLIRPLYQEVVLPNLCYIGGGGEMAYWLQLKSFFDEVHVPFPILLLRNSALLVSEKQEDKLERLHLKMDDLFLKQNDLINKRVKELSDISIDFTPQREHLKQQFLGLKEIALQTDASFIGAVNAQEKKQLNGLDALEKRLLKAQKRKLSDEIERITLLQNELFPKGSLEERTKNFSELYLEMGSSLIPGLFNSLHPLELQFTVIAL